MKNLILAVIAAVPFVTPAATPTPSSESSAPANANARLEQAEKRLRVTRALGLAEALDLDEVQALKMQGTLVKFDARRLLLWQVLRESAQVLQRAARGDQVTQAQVDQAVTRAIDARVKLQQLSQEMYQAVTQGLPPQKRARAAIFLAQFEGRVGTRLSERMAPGHGTAVDGGFGGGQWGGMGQMGHGSRMGAGPAADCPCLGGKGAPGTPPLVQ